MLSTIRVYDRTGQQNRTKGQDERTERKDRTKGQDERTGRNPAVMMIGRNSSALGDDSGVEWDLSPLLDYS